MVGVGSVGQGIFSIYLVVINYLTDLYEKYAASGLSAASLGWNTFGAFLPLGSTSLYTNLGFPWASSLLGFIGLALTLAPVISILKGETIRARSPFINEARLGSNKKDDGRDREERKQADITHG
jgi:hypothetical protein